ncbi:hypothetical protein ASF30_08025 [Leifsonia sp. Leaf264]|nr:hypothetical protein ASF30_08025 [Leifsonia sp. Leaf264]
MRSRPAGRGPVEHRLKGGVGAARQGDEEPDSRPVVDAAVTGEIEHGARRRRDQGTADGHDLAPVDHDLAQVESRRRLTVPGADVDAELESHRRHRHGTPEPRRRQPVGHEPGRRLHGDDSGAHRPELGQVDRCEASADRVDLAGETGRVQFGEGKVGGGEDIGEAGHRSIMTTARG